MNQDNNTVPAQYKIVPFLIGTFLITWICAFLKPVFDYENLRWLVVSLDFIESASPLIMAIILQRHYIFNGRQAIRFFLGEKRGVLSYIIVFVLFLIQFLNFYLFKTDMPPLSFSAFIITFASQLFFGGGLEEGGWRGYLLPAFEKKFPVLLSSLFVSLIWVFWHIPYFFMPGTMQDSQNFIFYSIVGIITGFILTAIYKLTRSVLLCTLFHSWQNAIVMSIQADTGNPWFMVIFILLGVMSVIICLRVKKNS